MLKKKNEPETSAQLETIQKVETQLKTEARNCKLAENRRKEVETYLKT